MSLYKTKINRRTEFVAKCDSCGYTTDSTKNKIGFMALRIECPICKKDIDMKLRGELPDPYTNFI